MKKLSFIILALLMVQGNLMAGGIIPVSRWKTHPILIDGNDSDWEKPVNFYDAKTGLFFAIRNDSTTLYLNFTATDQQKIQSLINGGLTLGFATKNKKSKTKASLVFGPSRGGRGMRNRMGMDEKLNLGSRNTPDRENRQPKQQGDEMPDASAQPFSDNRLVMDYSHNLRSFNAKGFIFTHDEVSMQNTTGVVVRIGQSDPAGLLYEVAIPLNELYEEESVKLNELINMTIVANSSGQSEGEAGTRQQGGGPGAMPGGGQGMSGGGPGGGMPGGGMPGGGMGGGMPGGGGMSKGSTNGERPEGSGSSSEKVIFKQKFRLTSH